MSPQQESEIYILSPVTQSDIPQLCALWQSAFASSRLHLLSFPPSIVNPQDLERWYIARVTKTLRDPGVRSFKITDTRTGQVVACSRWGFPHEKASGDAKSESSEPTTKDVGCEGMNDRLFDECYGTLTRWREKYVRWEDTYVAYLLMTHPDHQRKGLGRHLLKHVLDQADAEGRDAYIEASPDGYPLYIKSGFVEVDRITFGLEQHGGHPGEQETSVCLVRKPVPKKV